MPTPSEQLLTRTVYATDGVTTNWDFSFSGGYLDKSHVKAYTEAASGERTDVVVTEAMLVGPFQVRIFPALVTGRTLVVYRDTPKDLPLVDFTDESGFSEIALDTNAKQAVFIAAETVDAVNIDSVQAAAHAIAAANAAAASAVAANASNVVAAASATAAQGYLTAYRATSYGALASDPMLDPNGGAPTAGDEYFNTTSNLLKRYNGAAWQVPDINTTNLAAPSGASLVGFDGGTAQDVFDSAKSMQSYTALRTYTGRATGIRITTTGIFGIFQRSTTDTTSADNGGTIIVDASGRRWLRLFDGTVLLTWFGAHGNASGATGVGADDSSAIEAALSVSTSVNDILIQPGKTYRVTRTLNIVGNKTFRGPDAGTQGFQPAYIYHDSASTGPLFNVTNASSGVCLKNFTVIGGNGSFCITSSNSYVRYEYIRMAAYNGSGIQLLRTGVGSSSSKLINVSWTGPTSATSYTGFEIDIDGGDIWLTGCTAIYGAIGCNIKQGQTIVLDKCSFNKQNIYTGHSSATQFNTAGVKISGSDYKQAISIRNSYIEACTNGIYVEACESLSIEDNLFFDSGGSGVVGATVQYGNSAINLGGTNSKNVTIKNNYIEALSNGDASTTFYAIEFGDALNVQFDNNTVKTTGSYGGQWRVGASTTVTMRGNTKLQSGSNPQPDFDPSNKIRFVVTGDALAGAWYTATLTAPSTHIASSPVRYRRDALGFVHLKGGVENAPLGGAILTLPAGFLPLQQEGFGVNASGGGGAVSVDTGGTIVLRGGAGTYVYLSGIVFSVT